MKKILLTLSFSALVLSAPLYAAGDAAAGKAKSATCVACHGMDGNSAAPNFPKIAGQHEGYLYKQLMDFKTGKRVDPTMAGMVAALSKKDMRDLAAYYAGQTGSKGTTAEDQLALGQVIYRSGNATTGVSACAACHSPTGAGNPQANFPQLSGQHATYTESQLQQFAKGTRANDAGSMMRVIARKMSDAEMKAVSEYIQGLR
jgi:cytochrome c553